MLKLGSKKGNFISTKSLIFTPKNEWFWTKSGHMIGNIYSNLESKNKSEKYSCILSNTFNVETYEVSITVLSSADIPNTSKYTLGDLKNLTSIENK